MNDREHVENMDRIMLSDNDRHPFIVDSPVWDEAITPGLESLGYALPSLMQLGVKPLAITLRLVFESIYVLGYQQGEKRRQTRPTFICPEEETNEQP